MGYEITQRHSEFHISKKYFDAALAAIKALANDTHRMGGGSSSGERWFAWVKTADFVNATTLPAAIKAWRWDCAISKTTGDLIDICFDGEKLGDDAVFLNALAPYVTDGSYLEMQGEDDYFWRWVFHDGKVREVSGHIVFED